MTCIRIQNGVLCISQDKKIRTKFLYVSTPGYQLDQFMRANDPIIDFNQDIKQFQETPWSEVAADLTDQIIADMKVLTRAFTRQINIAELLTKDAEAFLAKKGTP